MVRRKEKRNRMKRWLFGGQGKHTECGTRPGSPMIDHAAINTVGGAIFIRRHRDRPLVGLRPCALRSSWCKHFPTLRPGQSPLLQNRLLATSSESQCSQQGGPHSRRGAMARERQHTLCKDTFGFTRSQFCHAAVVESWTSYLLGTTLRPLKPVCWSPNLQRDYLETGPLRR